jgi:NAD(P)-dependent dehydrogenase (short-subunit alcohol dehydrogenase family)
MSHSAPAQRTVLITGASSGIGRATAYCLASEGARLMLVARGIEALEATAAQCRRLGADAVAVEAIDLSEPDSGARAIDAALARLGRIDVVVHSAAVMAYGAVEELPAEVFERVIDVNLHGTARIARAALPLFRAQHGGTLVIVNSLLGRVTTPTMGAYVTSKWGQRALARVLQQEVRHAPGVHVCIIAPGSTNTPIYRQAANIVGRSPRPPVPVDSPERMAKAVMRTIRRPKRMRSVGLGNWAIETGFAAVPPVYDLVVGPMVRRLAFGRDRVADGTGNVFGSVEGANALHGQWREIR